MASDWYKRFHHKYIEPLKLGDLSRCHELSAKTLNDMLVSLYYSPGDILSSVINCGANGGCINTYQLNVDLIWGVRSKTPIVIRLILVPYEGDEQEVICTASEQGEEGWVMFDLAPIPVCRYYFDHHLYLTINSTKL